MALPKTRWNLYDIRPLRSTFSLDSPHDLATCLLSTERLVTGIPGHSYHRKHLLGLPLEIRRDIWQQVQNDIEESCSQNWASKPCNLYDGLLQTCRQIYQEIEYLWPQTILKHNRIQQLALPRTFHDHFNFRHLTLEIPFDIGDNFHQRAAIVLGYLAPYLQDLRIFYTGKDYFGIQTYIHGCGKQEAETESTSKKLTIRGQRHEERYVLFEALLALGNLRRLTLSNCNYPLLPALILTGKPHLECLHVDSDPRSTLHCNLLLTGLGGRSILAPQYSQFPPVTQLYINANAALTSLNIASKCARTLEHLTWLVPDSSRQSGSMKLDWFYDTAILLQNLRMTNRNRLHTLRICIEPDLYEGHVSYGTLIGAIRMHLPHLKGLEVVELHLRCKSPYFAQEFIEALPPCVKRLYTSMEAITLTKLEDAVLGQYSNEKDEVKRLIIPIRARNRETGVGEDLDRDDFIIMRQSNIGFVGYEWQDPACLELPEKAKLLMMNGKLLDRERNAHLKLYDGGLFIPPRRAEDKIEPDNNSDLQAGSLLVKAMEHCLDTSLSGSSSDDEEVAYSSLPLQQILVQVIEDESRTSAQLCQSWLDRVDITDVDNSIAVQIPPTIRGSTFSRFAREYFGMEDEAMRIFDAEVPAQVGDLSVPKWMEIVEVGEKEHWMTT